MTARPKSRKLQRLELVAQSEAPTRARNSRGLVRTNPVRAAKPAQIVAYDFETTPIAAGTPRPLYLTAYARDVLHLGETIRDMEHLRKLLRQWFLTDDMLGTKFVAWYGNGFDAYFIAAALVTDPDFALRPYLTRSNALRGLRVVRAKDIDNKKAKAWEFLDGMAMLGLQGVKLDKFLANFAPEYRKLTGAFDASRETFDPDNADHRAYAMRDSLGLWHAMERAQRILIETFDEPLRVTMGGACVRIFQRHVPEGVAVPTPREEVLGLVRDYVMRGGYVQCTRRYRGPVWKYDLNQAYAAAMREATLPAGFTFRVRGSLPECDAYIACIDARAPCKGNPVPFYLKREAGGRVVTEWAGDTITSSWLTGIEVRQLIAEGWDVDCLDAWGWESSFSMRDYVDKLERMRAKAEGGPSGPEGTMVKMVGNHSYGKLSEENEPVQTVLALNRPDGYWPYHKGDDPLPVPLVWFRWIDDEREKAYHQPQIAAHITAHVRMVVRRAALIDPKAWLYADTDCVIFACDVTKKLDVHPTRYGAWKVEESGAVYQIIGKKIYTEVDASKTREKLKRSAKGMNVNKLSEQDFDNWFDGEPPEQEQVQRQNFLLTMQGAEMYRAQSRMGTDVLGTIKKNNRRRRLTKNIKPWYADTPTT